MSATKAIVVAGSYYQYTLWLREHRLDRNTYRYIDHIDRLKGFMDIDCYLVGTYYTTRIWQYIKAPNFLTIRKINIRREDDIDVGNRPSGPFSAGTSNS